MKVNIDLKNKKGSLDVNAEGIIEKGMDQHEKNWNDKFNKKHNAKKEIMELKHKQKIDHNCNRQDHICDFPDFLQGFQGSVSSLF